MNTIRALPNLLSVFLFIMGIGLIHSALKTRGAEYIKFRRSLMRSAKRKIGSRLNSPLANRLLHEAGLPVGPVTYSVLRLTLTAVILMQALKEFIAQTGLSARYIALAALVYVLTMPVENFFGLPSPFSRLALSLETQKKHKIDRELYKVMTQLKNLSISHPKHQLSADWVLEQLMQSTTVTRKAFSRLLSSWRLGEIEAGCEIFSQMLDTKIARELSSLLGKLDNLEPGDLTTQLCLFQDHMQEEQVTRHQKRQELMSYALYVPVIASAFLIMINFIVIVIWLDTIRLIEMI